MSSRSDLMFLSVNGTAQSYGGHRAEYDKARSPASPTGSQGLGRQRSVRFSDDEREDDDCENDALHAVYRDPDPSAAVALRRAGDGEHVEQRCRHRPRHVQVVAGEEKAVRDPVAAPERTVHAREEVAAEQELLADDGEDEHCEGNAVPAPRTVEECLAGIRFDQRDELPVLGCADRWDELVGQREGDDQRDDSEPDPPADAAAPRASWGAQPECFADRRVAEGPLLATDEDRNEDELPHEADRERYEQRLRHRHVAVAGELVRQQGRENPGER